jgi:hypothetical protein
MDLGGTRRYTTLINHLVTVARKVLEEKFVSDSKS